VEFLLLDRGSQLPGTAVQTLAELFSGNERILVLADNRQYLEQMDELLWHKSREKFIPYSMDSECYALTAMVQLTDKQPQNVRYQALLNMGTQFPDKPEQFRRIIELVNSDENCIEKARGHYKSYRQLGFTVSHQQLSSDN